eukprot:TRINITY_DN7614_c0_g1_i1.p1 TRINITY_DN7614_c0_g1~~TRINITY_DN7614_c0_g1_i1.p1  ORF type:complete len:529 (+),score=55.43 TRINITY_DN7614_c0_g1_i1:301-1887(+)
MAAFWVVVCSFVLPLFSFLWISSSIYRRREATSSSGLPKPYPLLGHLFEIIRNKNRIESWMTEILAESQTQTVEIQVPGHSTWVLTANPKNVQHILSARFQNYPKGREMSSYLSDFLGDGILVVDGEPWKTQRKIAAQEFTSKSLRQFLLETVNAELRDRLLPILDKASDERSDVDLQDLLKRFAMDNVGKLALGVDLESLDPSLQSLKEVFDAFDTAQQLLYLRFNEISPIVWKFKRFFNCGSEKTLRRCIAVVKAFTDEVIRRRREELQEMQKNDFKESGRDLLSRFVALQHKQQKDTDKEKSLKDETLRDIMINFLFAGRDTSSSALTAFFWFLLSNRSVEDRIRDEIGQILSARTAENTSDILFSYEELKQMKYLQACLWETMRLIPPVPSDAKSIAQDDVLPDGRKVKGGWMIGYHVYAMGRMKRIWGDDCLEFRPERWICAEPEELQEKLSPFVYPVFQAGPRICLGKDLALIQMKAIAASVISGYTLSLRHSYTPRFCYAAITTFIDGGFPVCVSKRRKDD